MTNPYETLDVLGTSCSYLLMALTDCAKDVRARCQLSHLEACNTLEATLVKMEAAINGLHFALNELDETLPDAKAARNNYLRECDEHFKARMLERARRM